MFESTIDDGSQDLELEEEISKSRAMDRYIGALDFLLRRSKTFLGGSLLSGLLLFFIIQKIVLCIGHGESGRYFSEDLQSEGRR
jgi:hypothetical protein